MLRKAFFAIALIASLSTAALAETNLQVGNWDVAPGSTLTFPIVVSSDSGDTLQGVELFLVMDPTGPVITNVDMLTGTVFESNNIGVGDFADPMFLTPGRQPAYFTGTTSGTVPVGTVAFVTIDATGIAPGQYILGLNNEILGPSAAYNAQGVAGITTAGVITVVPEPGTVVLGLFAAAGLGAVAIRRRRARNA